MATFTDLTWPADKLHRMGQACHKSFAGHSEIALCRLALRTLYAAKAATRKEMSAHQVMSTFCETNRRIHVTPLPQANKEFDHQTLASCHISSWLTHPQETCSTCMDTGELRIIPYMSRQRYEHNCCQACDAHRRSKAGWLGEVVAAEGVPFVSCVGVGIVTLQPPRRPVSSRYGILE